MKILYSKYVLLILLVSTLASSQSKFNKFFKVSDTLNKSRRNTVLISEAAVSTITLIGLSQLWYADYEQSKFHTTNDNKEWLQLDKVGHSFTAYQMGKHGAQLLNWSGVNKTKQLVYGATLGFTFLSAVEVLDGFSQEWGFSWGDIAANATGTGLYVGQELLWNEQRISLKYSFHHTKLAEQSPDKLGSSYLEQTIKDYNGQTYWLSFNLKSFFKESALPKWLNVAVGYGGNNMLGGVENEFNDVKRYRQFYFSLDFNLKNINTNSEWINTLLDVLNMIKIPFPTLEINKNYVKFRHFYY
ncbi:DUF2279 domain-containing protein [Neotamlana laminarinivorans]|uniref:YfiM family protein n=1 Tax=Neotamlana laminarinivorans TaxID=2883124 RepID=A0A9X1HYU9_9FLAO|nr:DUF2279 domain-containing protein [Tamlana laminarinivorans]MCB4797463.1 YfiM family protein [Tamlana laminarinivorans]